MDLQGLLYNPWMGLGLGVFGIILHIFTKPEGEDLLGIWEWTKNHQKTLVMTCLSWFAIWLLWSGGALSWMLPDKVGPLAVVIGYSANSIFGHVTDQYKAHFTTKKIS